MTIDPKKRASADEPWTEKDLKRLAELRDDDASPRLIAVKMRRTRKAVEAKIAEMRAAGVGRR